MSKGLGALQREIVITLEDAKHANIHYLGSVFGSTGWVVVRGCEVQLAPGVYDLRASLGYLAKKHGKYSHCTFVEASFQASFSRAVKSLVDRDVIKVIDLVPIQKVGSAHNGRVLHLADGLYLNANLRQRRFVELNGHKCYTYIHNTYG